MENELKGNDDLDSSRVCVCGVGGVQERTLSGTRYESLPWSRAVAVERRTNKREQRIQNRSTKII